MTSRLRSIARLHASERLAISFIRSASERGGAIPRPFLRLARLAAESGRNILPMKARYLSDDEKLLIAWIAMFQRGRGSEIASDNAPLNSSFNDCSLWLTDVGLHLPFYCTARISTFADRRRDGHRSLEGPNTLAPLDADRDSPISRANLKTMAANFARDRGVVTSRDLKNIGVSRQYVSLLCKRGVLQRIGFGLYGPPSAASVNA